MVTRTEIRADADNPPYTNRGVTEPGFLAGHVEGCHVSVDWVTATSPLDKVGMGWWDLFARHCEKTGESWDGWTNRFYSGAKTEGLFWGTSPKWGYIFIASGDNARVYAPMATYSAQKITRMDLQVTVLLDRYNMDLASNHYYALDDSYLKERKYALVNSSDDGQTLYIGRRVSEQFGRLYDKGVEAQVAKPGLMWRYEVELKKPRSGTAAIEVMKKRETIGLSRAIQTYVHQWFLMRGVKPLFHPEGDPIIVEVSRRVTTDERKLEWLRTQVRPSVQKLMGKGLGPEVLEALGID